MNQIIIKMMRFIKPELKVYSLRRFISLTLLGFLMIVTLNSYAIKQNSKVSLKLKHDGIYEIAVSDLVMEVNANFGARIISFRLKNQELLSSKEINPENYGSTLWLSPQIWGWPPPPVLDTEPYQVKIDRKTLNLTSRADSKTGCKISKSISANSSDSSFSINYSITNISNDDKSVAPWEVTRVPAGGLTFFPVGPSGGFSKSNMVTEDINNICWYRYEPALVTGHQKLFRNGAEGWLAHCNQGLIFIKQFPDIDITQEAPKETEVELYIHKDRTYIELENQGIYKTLRPGESVTWKVKWYLRQLPLKIKTDPGSVHLSEFVRKTIQ